jgi:hypothetical protein
MRLHRVLLHDNNEQARFIMKSYYDRIKPHWDREVASAARAEFDGDPHLAFRHLERAHILGQNSTWLHTQTHFLMMRWGLRQPSGKEVAGQLFRIFGAATKTAFGLVPAGNTGGANVSPFRTMPIPADLQILMRAARSND